MSQPAKILTGLVVGATLGSICHFVFGANEWVDFFIRNVAQLVGQIFLRSIFMVVIPLVFSSLVLGVFELGEFKSLGRVGVKTLLYTVVASITSVIIGLTLVSTLKPGKGLDPQKVASLRAVQPESASKAISQAGQAKSLVETVLSFIPKNPLLAAANALEGDMIALMFFALVFGIALSFLRNPEDNDPLIGSLVTLRDLSMKIVDYAMVIAPFGVAGLIFSITAKLGWDILIVLGKYVLIVVVGLLFQQVVVFGALLKFYAKRSPLLFLKQTREVIIMSFSTASSNATLPTTIRVAEQELKLDKKISSFVLTIGSTANQNGTALFEGVTILFLAQVYGIDLSMTQQITVLFMSVLAGVGTAGVPGGSIPLIVIVLQSVGIPPEGIGIILGVDRFLDMCRTVLNVTGDLVAATVVDYSERKPLDT